MRKDTSLSDRKLTREEFAAKYWKGGDPSFIYQYHTMEIEDGRDEREQLIINNIRALMVIRDFDRRYRWNAEKLDAASRNWDAVKDFLSYPAQVFRKPEAWDAMWLDEQRAWRSRRRWFVLQLLALAVSVSFLVRTYL